MARDSYTDLIRRLRSRAWEDRQHRQLRDEAADWIEKLERENLELQHAADMRHAGPSGRIELGCPGHFIAVRSCNWRRHTQVGNYRVSSIGDYFPERGGKRETIGAGDTCFFETMVFKTLDSQDENNEGCGCRQVAGWSEVDSERYATAGEAQAGHERYVEKYMRHAATDGGNK